MAQCHLVVQSSECVKALSSAKFAVVNGVGAGRWVECRSRRGSGALKLARYRRMSFGSGMGGSRRLFEG